MIVEVARQGLGLPQELHWGKAQEGKKDKIEIITIYIACLLFSRLPVIYISLQQLRCLNVSSETVAQLLSSKEANN